MSFRSLLEAAMGDAQELPQDEVGRIDAQMELLDEEDQASDGPADESDDAYVPPSSEEDDDAVEEEEEDSDIERQLWGKSRKRRRRGSGRQGRRRRRGGPTGKRSVTAAKVPPELANVLGEANMLYASHQYDEAITLLKDFIKKAPTIPDPYHTLGMIYEDRQDRIKALQFFLIACTLTPQDAELWKRVGRIAKDEKNFDQALFCFKKASSADPKDKEALFSYAELCREQGDNRRAAEVFKKLTVLIPNDLSLWIQIAEAYHCNEQEDEAVDALKMCIEKAATLDPTRNLHSSKYELNAVNMLADLYITLKKYREAIEVIHHLHARDMEVEEEADDDDEDAEEQTRMEMAPDPSLSVDAMENGIRLKLLIEWGHLKKLSGEAEKFLAKLLRDDPESYPAILLAGHQSSAWDIASLTVASMQRTINDRQHTVAKAFAFLQQYERTRVAAPSDITTEIRQVEAWYNIGRAHQQLGLFHLAIAMYERVLRFFDSSKEQKREVPPEYLLCRETAYNLSLIYKQR
ncbi:RNA polymerase III transcription factor TFIIIC [Phytophthora cinnamomi]|uniref:RNA polymerase III transcription factor TFIIIC n=1 Tax=Phytophthora cinnamomi TaxID=4785 RepID=UPI00355A5DD1|nr:RNA polymerase III transcription factor TFIIIC [Phytophthora cinnamomi]